MTALRKPFQTRRVLWLVIALGVVGALVVASWPSGQEPGPQQRAEALSSEIRCPTCQGLSVAESDSPLAMNARDEIERRVEAGESDDAVRDYFVSRYGESALMSPERGGVSLLVWIAPVVFGSLAVVGLVFAVRKWRRQPEAVPASQPEDAARVLSPSTARAVVVDKRAVVGVCSVVLLVIAVGVGLDATERNEGAQITGELAADSNTLLADASRLIAQNEPAEALERYDAVLERDSTNAEALAYKGWLVRLAGLPDEGLASIEAAISAEPDYPDARFFKGYILLHDRNQPGAAISEFEAFLANDPPPEMVPLVQSALDDARSRIAAS